MEESKTSVLGQLYSIRAGLSMISKEREQSEAAVPRGEAECEKLDKEVERLNREVTACGEVLGRAHVQSDIIKQNIKTNRSIAGWDTEERQVSMDSDYKATIFKGIGLLILFLLGLALAGFMFVGGWTGCDRAYGRGTEPSDMYMFYFGECVPPDNGCGGCAEACSGFWFYILGLLPLGGAGAAIYFAVKFFREASDMADSYKKSRANAKRDAENAAESVRDANAKIIELEAEYERVLAEENVREEEYRKDLAAAEERYKTKYEEVYKQKADIRQKAKEEEMSHAIIGNNIVKAMKASYSGFLDYRDWENIDMIIYSIETGRADTVKEALSIVDNERRAQRIVQSIQEASVEIRRSINDGLDALQTNMVTCFSVLSKQITLQSEQMVLQTQIIAGSINSMQSDMRSLQSSINGMTAQIATEGSMQRALLEKANRSSAELAADVRYISDVARKYN